MSAMADKVWGTSSRGGVRAPKRAKEEKATAGAAISPLRRAYARKEATAARGGAATATVEAAALRRMIRLSALCEAFANYGTL
jgi:hypothetical protein